MYGILLFKEQYTEGSFSDALEGALQENILLIGQ